MDACINTVNPILDVESLRVVLCKLKVGEIDLQLDWHRKQGNKTIPMKKLLKRKSGKLKALIDAVKAYRVHTIQNKADGEGVHDKDNFKYFSDPNLY